MTDNSREDKGGLDLDPFARPSDMPPAEDPDPDALGALVRSAPSWPKAAKAPAGPADDERLDLAALAREVSATSSASSPALASPPAARASDVAATPSAPPARAAGKAEVEAAEPVDWRPPRSGPPGWLFGLVAGLGLGFGAGALVFRAPSAESPPAAPPAASAPVVAATPTPPPVVAAAVPVIAPPPEAVAAAIAPGAPPPAAAPVAPIHEPAASPARPGALTPVEAPALPPAPAPSSVPGPSAASPTPPPASATAPAAPSQEQNFDTLLDEALSPTARQEELRQQRELARRDVVPETPSREQVEEAMAVLRPAIRGCAMGQTGLATADIVVRSDGSVAGVRVSGAPFAGSASGRCMEGVARRAQFPRFKKESFHVRFPFAIQ